MTRQLEDFEGRWHMARTITHAKGPPGRFTGVATWARAGGAMRYEEEGALKIGDHPPIQAERRYLWRDDLTVWFEDGRFFHQVPADGGDTAHWCDPDQYDGFYDFTDWPRFRVRWRVKGPSKEYDMVTEYTRAP